MNRFVVIDLETTGHASTKDDKIIEIGIVVIEGQEIVQKYSTFLNPERTIPSFISNLTGISEEDVADAPLFDDVASEIRELFENSYLIAHNVPFDLGFLNDELKHAGYNQIHCPVIDTVELSRILYPSAPSYKLQEIADFLNIQHETPHRALADAYVTAELFLRLIEKLSSLPLETINQLLKLEKHLQSDLVNILSELQEQNAKNLTHRKELISYNGLAFKSIEDVDLPLRTNSDSFADFMEEIYGDEGTLSKEMKNYEKRLEQVEMSHYVFDAFQSKQHAILEAETGTGKTLGYLLPAIYEAVQTNTRIVISTYTTQLQSQILDKEIPLIQKIVPFSFNTALLKGKSHYLSLEKFAKELTYNEYGNYDIILTKAMLLIWITETDTGDIDEIHLPSSGYQFFRRISAEADGNRTVHSAWHEYNYYERARNQAEQAHLIITNHALLCTDLLEEYDLLPSYDRIIIDEAHHLEHIAAERFGLHLDYVQIQFTLNRLGSTEDAQFIHKIQQILSNVPLDFSNWNKKLSNVKYEIDELFRFLFNYVQEQTRKIKTYGDTGRIQYRFSKEDASSRKYRAICDMTERISFELYDLIQLLSDFKAYLSEVATEEFEQLCLFMKQLEFYKSSLKQIFIGNHSNDFVRWIEIEAYGAKNAVFLYCEPLQVNDKLYTNLFSKKESVVLTSATLTMNQSFTYIKERLGIDQENVLTKQIASVFNYKDQVQLLIPNDFPDVNDNLDDFTFATAEAIFSLAEVTDGRMLVLFTSFEMLKKTYGLLREFMEDEPYVLIAQGISSGSRERLKKNFQSFEHSILLGTNSFWEGIDIPGDDLSCTVIVRLPFQPPSHPIYAAKAKQLEQEGKSAFRELALPNAVIRFKQGFGRLIRSKTDRGIVFVCDTRIMTTTYGKFFLDSIPKVPITYDSTKILLEKAEKWF